MAMKISSPGRSKSANKGNDVNNMVRPREF